MIGKGVEAGAGTTDVIGSRGHPSVLTGNVDQLVFVESGERNISWSTLSLLMLFWCFWRISLLKMPFQEVGILEGSLCIRAEAHGCSRQGKTQDGGCKPHDVYE